MEKQIIIDNPSFWPVSISEDGSSFCWKAVGRENLSASKFLDHRGFYPNSVTEETNVSDLLDRLRESEKCRFPVPTYIFHSAFCGSTLLAQILDKPGKSLSLKEPHVLAQIANLKRRANFAGRQAMSNPDLVQCLHAMVHVFKRRGDPHILIKPTNLANNLIPDLLASGGKAIMLYSSLEDFLLSIVKRGEEGHVFVRQCWQAAIQDKEAVTRISPQTAMLYSDLQIAAIIWRQQIESFEHYLSADQNNQTRSLDISSFLNAPLDTLGRLSQFYFGDPDYLKIDQTELIEKLGKDSKTDQERSSLEKAESIGDRDMAVIQDVLHWARNLKLEKPLDFPLSNDLAATSND